MVSEGVERIARERERQIAEEGWTEEHDVQSHPNGTLALAAALYATPEPLYAMERRANGWSIFDPWPWDPKWDKRQKHDRMRQLEIAGALIAAEIDRLCDEVEP